MNGKRNNECGTYDRNSWHNNECFTCIWFSFCILEAKSSHRRFSRRLASKRAVKSHGNPSTKVARTIPQKPARRDVPTPPPYPPPTVYVDGGVSSPLARPPIRGNAKRGQAPPPPPPPPPPPSGKFLQPKPLGERTNTVSVSLVRKPIRSKHSRLGYGQTLIYKV